MIAALVLLAIGAPVSSQTIDTTEIPTLIFVLDLSGSMLEGSPTKLDQAKEALRLTIDALPDGTEVALRVYGDQFEPMSAEQRQEGCLSDTRLAIPPGPLDRGGFVDTIDALEARGDTPIALALEAAGGDVPSGDTGTIVLVSDGRDECFDADLDGDSAVGPSWGRAPCEVAEELVAEGNEVQLDRVETVGFQTDEAAELELRCIAEVTGGSYTPAGDAADLANKLIAIATRAFRRPVRLGGLPVDGTPAPADAPVVGAGGESQGRFTDTIPTGEPVYYRADFTRDLRSNVTATIFGLPQREGITFHLGWTDEDGDDYIQRSKRDAGTDGAGSDSVRLPGVYWYGGGEEDVRTDYIRLLVEADPALEGEYDIELVLEGAGLGGAPLGCAPETVCAYEGLVPLLVEQRDDLAAEAAECCAPDQNDGGNGETSIEALAPEAVAELEATRDQLVEDIGAADAEIETLEARRLEVEEAGSAAAESVSDGPGLFPWLVAVAGLAVLGLGVFRRRGALAGTPPSDVNGDGSMSEATGARSASPPGPTSESSSDAAAPRELPPESDMELEPTQEYVPIQEVAPEPRPPADVVGDQTEQTQEIAAGSLAQPDPGVEAPPDDPVTAPVPVDPTPVEEKRGSGRGSDDAPAAPAGWYPHPDMPEMERYWNGVEWENLMRVREDGPS